MNSLHIFHGIPIIIHVVIKIVTKFLQFDVFFPLLALWYSQLQQQMSPSGSSATAGTTPTAELAGSPKGESGSAGGGGGGDGPLDLSAKPGTSGLNAAAMMAAMMDPKHYK